MIIDPPWIILIHPSLRIVLSVSGKIDNIINRQLNRRSLMLKKYDVVEVTVKEIKSKYIIVTFMKHGYKLQGYLSINNFGRNDVEVGKLYLLCR